MFHAMVSVMAVKIQFSSPSGVFLSLSLPGILGVGKGITSSNEQGTYCARMFQFPTVNECIIDWGGSVCECVCDVCRCMGTIRSEFVYALSKA